MLWTIAAVIAALAALALEAWAVFFLGWRRAADLTAEPFDPVLPRLVFAGPFAHVRHPQSLGLLLLLAASALYWRSAGMWAAVALAAVCVVLLARRDDRACAARFGEAYARYQRAVPFMIPGLG
jgi:protein-S-isoprenylcysteine O-methyltransferase Ste14